MRAVPREILDIVGEPDREEAGLLLWVPRILEEFESHGLDCYIRNSSAGNLLGYVRSPRDVGMTIEDGIVHGGITYAEEHSPWLHAKKGWYYGFDCGHYGDLIPGWPEPMWDGPYRDKEYVRRELEKLAKYVRGLLGGKPRGARARRRKR